MKRERNNVSHIWYVLLFAFAFIALVITGWHDEVRLKISDDTEISAGWTTEDGVSMSLSDLSEWKEDRVIVYRPLPSGLKAGDALNFNSHNTRFAVYLEDPSTGSKPVYQYHPASNISGEGYGDVFHHIPLDTKMAGKPIYLLLEPIFSSSSFERVYIEPEHVYYYRILSTKGFSFALSMIVVFMGCNMLLLLGGTLANKTMERFMLGIALGAITLGLWSSIETTVPSLLFVNHIQVIRVADYLLPPLAEYPFVVALNAMTVRQRRLYEYISAIMTSIAVFATMVCRFALAMDLHHLPFLPFTFAAHVILVAALLADNLQVVRKEHIKQDIKLFYIGVGIFMLTDTLDLIIYQGFGKQSMDNGFLLRIGMVGFMMLLFLQIARMMVAVRMDTSSNRFINELLRYSMSAGSPEKIVSKMLEYLGKESGAQKVYIEEEESKGARKTAYEWKAESGKDLSKNKAHIEETLAMDGRRIGYLSIDNLSQEEYPQINYSRKLIAFFVSVILRRRDNEELLRHYSYYDQLTKAKNRRALEEDVDHCNGKWKQIGVIMCDINGLKRANDEEGHEAGDAMICDVADTLMEVLGEEHVYRMGGDEFLAISFAEDEEELGRIVKRLTQGLDKKGRSASFGAVSGDGSDGKFEELQRQADARMYEAKRLYYQDHPARK